MPSPVRNHPSRVAPVAHSTRACAQEDSLGRCCARTGTRASRRVANRRIAGRRISAEIAGIIARAAGAAAAVETSRSDVPSAIMFALLVSPGELVLAEGCQEPRARGRKSLR